MVFTYPQQLVRNVYCLLYLPVVMRANISLRLGRWENIHEVENIMGNYTFMFVAKSPDGQNVFVVEAIVIFLARYEQLRT